MATDSMRRNHDNEVLEAIVEEALAKFARLRSEWQAKRGHKSSAEMLALHPAYQKIIGMGPEAIPFILRELEADPDWWFWALRSITEAYAVTNEARGNVKKMAAQWLEWPKDKGYEW